MSQCYICGDACRGDDEAFVCETCGVVCHRHCMDEYHAEACPRCVGEVVIGAVEF